MRGMLTTYGSGRKKHGEGNFFAVLLLAIGVITGDTTAADERLFTLCAPMDFAVEDLAPEGAQRTGLAKKSIEAAVESRLRSAGLFVPLEKQGRGQFLQVAVTISGLAFGIEVRLNRRLDNLGYGVPGYATVWDTGSVGTHGNNGQYILGSVSGHLDKFIASYLRVNERPCSNVIWRDLQERLRRALREQS